MQEASAQTERRLAEHEQRARGAWEESYARAQRAEAERIRMMEARFDDELEAVRAASVAAQAAERAAEEERRRHRQLLALQEQQHNPLGLHYPPALAARGEPAATGPAYSSAGASPPPYAPSAAAHSAVLPTAPPVYTPLDTFSPKEVAAAAKEAAARGERGAAAKAAAAEAAMKSGPPPAYEVAAGSEKAHKESELFVPHAPLVEAGFVPEATAGGPPPRCATCFDPIVANAQWSGRAVREMGSIYHLECWCRSAAPHCAYCARTLMAHPEESLSGCWGEYRGKRYHLECYQYYAGPRCCLCFDVIFANPARGVSGQWRALRDGALIHEECFQRRGDNRAPK